MLVTKGGNWPWLMGYNSGHDSFYLSVQFLPFPFFPFSLFVLTPYALELEMGGRAAAGGVLSLKVELVHTGLRTEADAIVTSRQMERTDGVYGYRGSSQASDFEIGRGNRMAPRMVSWTELGG